MKRLGVDDKQLTPRNVLGRISWAKNHMLDPQEVYLQSADPNSERVAHIYEVYKQELAKSNALDFDDLLLYAVRVLKVSGETRGRYNRRYQHLLVDEYQDTNRPQYELMRLLAGEEHNVCAVGDEDQSIYSWRGADIRNIAPPRTFSRLPRRWWPTMFAARERTCGRIAWAARRSGITKRRTVKTKRCSPPITFQSTWRKPGKMLYTPLVPPYCTAPIRSRACWKKPCAVIS
jgi:hypothetical protein